MDKKSRQFFTALNTFSNRSLDVIDINHVTLEEILEKYNKYGQSYLRFIETEKGTQNARKSEMQKKEYDKMFRFWIDPFHIALRNEIGRIGLPKPKVEKITKDIGDKARLTQSTISKIKGKYIEELELKKYTVNRQRAIQEILKIVEELKLEQQQQKEGAKAIEESNKNHTRMLQEIESYTFETGPVNNFKSYIKKYRLSLKDNGVEHAIEVYGDVDLDKFYNDAIYKRVVLEAIEDLELENYLNGLTNRKDSDYIGCIGNFRSIVKDGAQIWQQEIRESDLDAIKKISKLNEKYKMMASKQNDYLKLGEDK